MNRLLLSLTLFSTLLLGSDLSAHGGTYRGPGDTVPPAGGGAAAPVAPAAPGAPAAPAAPGAPATPNSPNTPTTPAVVTAPTAEKAKTPTTGGSSGPDLTTWEFWWEFNKEPFLNLKAKIQSGNISTGESELMIGLSSVSTDNNTFAPSPQQIRGIVLPALKRSLGNDTNRDILSSDLIAMAKIGRDTEIPALLEPFLSHGNQEIAETAALAYGILQHSDALPQLRDLALDTANGRKLVDSENGVALRTRTFAAYGMGLVAHSSDDSIIRNQVANTLWELLSTDTSALKDIRVASVIGLGLTLVDNPAMVQNLSAYLADPSHDELVRAHCPNAIAKLIRHQDDSSAADAAVDQFLALLQSKGTKTRVRQSCVQGLGMLAVNAPSSGQKILEELLRVAEKGKDRQEKNFTTIALADLGAAVEGPIRDKVVEYLNKNVRKGSTPYRPWAAMGLGVMAFKLSEQGDALSDVAGRTVHAAFKKEKSPSPKAGYAIALGLMRFEEAKKDIRSAMEKSRVADFRGYSAVSLGLMGATENKEYISEMVRESRRLGNLLQQAAIALGLMKDHSVVDTLLDLMAPPDGSSPGLPVLSASATALGFIGDHRSVDPLVRILGDEDMLPIGRAFAAVALGLVGDKEMLPWNSKIGQDLNYRASVSTLVDKSSGTGILDIL
ncbi:MAG: hypothetical protein QGH51_06970 [Planctomycetota bacterium]|jgi:HEAT repeat protein|nr:hypothetical protein [Planctomycetota bacterium]MDP6941752.1 hypothetical protein [Planctomycetota bacterium]